jgi:hypothetical protein
MCRCPLVLILVAFVISPARADEAEEKLKALVAKQKKAAEENWALLEAGEFAQLETDHFLLVAPRSMEKKLKEAGTLLENAYKTGREALKFPEKTEPFKGKLTVYLFTERGQFTAFIRRVEKRKLVSGESASMNAADDALHVASGPPQGKGEWSIEAQAVEQAGGVMIQRRAGLTTVLPEWLLTGFGRAMYYRALPKDTLTQADRRTAARLVVQKKKAAKDIWTGPLEADEAGPLSGALADFFAYGPGAQYFEKLLEGFKPEENVEKKTMDQALEKTKINKDKIDPEWKRWVANPN